MSNLENIFSINEWNVIKNNPEGLFIDNEQITDEEDKKDIYQAAKRALEKNMKKLCGGIERFEQQYGDIIIPLYLANANKFKTIINKSSFGYVSFNDLKLKSKLKSKIKDIFVLKEGTVGKGEVLLACLFSDVYISRRTHRSGQTNDCEIPGKYRIEVKTKGSEFDAPSKSNNYKQHCVDMISDYIIKRYNENESTPLIFICFDNYQTTPLKKDESGKCSVLTTDSPSGFFWLKYNGDENELKNILSDNIKLLWAAGEHKNKFSITADHTGGLICYCSLFKEEKSEV